MNWTPTCRSGELDAPLWPGRIRGSHGDPRGLDYQRQFDVGSVIRYYFKPALKELGLQSIRWHDLRHYYATVMISRIGIDAKYTMQNLSEWMGHAKPSITSDVYGHLLKVRPDVDVLDAVMRDSDDGDANVTPIRA